MLKQPITMSILVLMILAYGFAISLALAMPILFYGLAVTLFIKVVIDHQQDLFTDGRA